MAESVPRLLTSSNPIPYGFAVSLRSNSSFLMTSPTHNSNGMAIEPYLGYARNFLGSGYNCPRLKLFGYRTEQALNHAIAKAIKPAIAR